jgi:probable HAF family extracellular repeat protein
MCPCSWIFRLMVFLIALTGFTTAQSYTVTDLGVLPGYSASLGNFVNNLGQVVGCSDVSTPDVWPCGGSVASHAFLWSAVSGMQDLGTLPGGTISIAEGINDSGVVSGFSNDSQGVTHGFRWTQSNGMVDLGTLPGGTTSYAFAINAAGLICGYSDSGTSKGVKELVAWTPQNKIIDLGSLPGATNNQGLSINDHNQIVGAAIYSQDSVQGFVAARNGGLQILPTLSGGPVTIAGGNNNAGIVVGSSSAPNGKGLAVAWNRRLEIQILGALPGGLSSYASDINDSNQVVGWSTISSGYHRAVLWTQSGGIQNLNKLIPLDSGWLLGFAITIANSGQITGSGLTGGQNHAFLLTPQ